MSESVLRAALGVLALAGAAIAAYLTVTKVAHARVACPTSGCDTVQSSRYSKLFGVPVAGLGLLAYIVILATAARAGAAFAAAGAAVALAAAAFAGYLLVVQVALIHAICVWCVASDIVAGALAALAVARLASLGHNDRSELYT